MKSFFEYLDNLPDRPKIMGCLLLSVVIGAADYITGDYSLSLFYLIPIGIAAWFIGKKTALYFALFCGAELYSIDLLIAPGKLALISLRSWNALMEVSCLFLMAYLITVVRAQMETSRQKSLQLESLNHELNAFNYTVAHDLRQPLNVINSYCQAIKDLCGDKLEEPGNDYLQEIYEGSLRMDSLIETLLVFSSTRSVKPLRETFDLSELAQEVATMLRISEPKRSIDFQCADRTQVTADINLMRIVLENLLGNAWKYTHLKQDAVIEFGATQTNKKPVYFVRDNGIGFNAAEAGGLFIPFKRLPGSESYRGTGIGLSTVERIIRRHGGRVWAEGEPGVGATFYFTLPEIVGV